ncbi:MAG: cofactor-independent phosphoglycerate mutase [Promethearchaeota archaeon]
MKYILVIGDGMADDPADGSKTPLEVARTPALDRVALKGKCGRFVTIPPGFKPGSDVAIGSILGADPTKYYTGRGPLEAAAMGVELAPTDVAARCNLVTIADGVIDDYSAGHVTNHESRELIRAVDEELGVPGDVEFFPGVSYRHLLVLRGNYSDEVECAPPHDHLGERADTLLVRPTSAAGELTAKKMNELIERSQEVLAGHEVNLARQREGKRPANSVWFWSPGRKPTYDTIPEKYGLSGAVISAVDLVKGLGIYSGLQAVEVPGATGYLDTDYAAKVEAALRVLKGLDLVVIHVEAPDEASHEGSLEKKVRAIEDLDREVVGELLRRLDPPYRLCVCADHPTPLKLRTHTSDPPPFAVYEPGVEGDSITRFSEREAGDGAYGQIPAVEFLQLFLGG